MLSPVALSAISATNLNDTLNWHWDLGNGNIFNNQSATYSYSTAGAFNVKVIGTNMAGCADTIEQPIRIDPLPFTDAGQDSVICLGESVILIPGGADVYDWLTDASLSCTNCANPTAKPLQNATYFVTGINNYGCKAGDSVRIEVKQPSEVSVIAPDTLCQGKTIQLKANGEELYSWLPSNAVTNATGSQTSSTPYATTIYSVIGTDTKGCFSDTASITVHVFPYPVIQLPDSLVTIEAGSSYQINAAGSGDIISWQWSPLTGLSCTNCMQPVAKPKLTTTYTAEGRNIAGCTTENNITIMVLCKNQNLFVPNTFSPNGDGMNDYFYPRGKGLFTIKSLRIFSRWGNIVFERMNFPPNEQSYGWNGTYQGKVLHPDVYVFVMEVVCDNGVVISSKGNITLLR
jgi:gliding motility-associated-like protein